MQPTPTNPQTDPGRPSTTAEIEEVLERMFAAIDRDLPKDRHQFLINPIGGIHRTRSDGSSTACGETPTPASPKPTTAA